MSSPRSTTTPFSCTRATEPAGSTPAENRSTIWGHGSSVSCLIPREIRFASASTSSTRTFTSSPFWMTSDGCSTRRVQLRSETCTSPSIPDSISTNAPKDVRFRTTPSNCVPVGYLAGSASHGSSSICFIPREIFSSCISTFNTTASISSPMFTSLEGCRMLRVHDISEI